MARLFYSLCFVIFTSTISFNLWAASLTVSDNLIVTEINNKLVDHGFLGNKSVFSLESGEHALVLHYKDVFEDVDFAEDRVVKSKEFVVKLIIADQNQLNLKTAPIKNLAQADAFAKTPELILIDEKNKQIRLELENVSDYKIAQQVNIAVNTYASKQAVKSDLPLTKSKVIKTPQIKERKVVKQTMASAEMNKQPDNTLIQVNSLAMLKYWWQNASKEEKKHFKQYISTKK